MEQEMRTYVESIDAWIKQIRREFSEFQDHPKILQENSDNTQHNYELIHELKDQMEELKQEIHALKLIQIVSMKKNEQENFN